MTYLPAYHTSKSTYTHMHACTHIHTYLEMCVVVLQGRHLVKAVHRKTSAMEMVQWWVVGSSKEPLREVGVDKVKKILHEVKGQ